MQQSRTQVANRAKAAAERIPEARYAYYRRCQIFRTGSEQCKAPAEKGSHICYAHAGQLATAVRRERERRAVLAEAVAQMRKRVRPDCKMADLSTDFNGIQITIGVTMQALIEGKIDCKTAGRLVVQLQTVSKLLRMLHRKGCEGRKEKQISPQISADERRLETKTLPLINTNNTDRNRDSGTSGDRGIGKQKLTPELRRARRHREKTSLTAEARRRGEEPKTERNWAQIQISWRVDSQSSFHPELEQDLPGQLHGQERPSSLDLLRVHSSRGDASYLRAVAYIRRPFHQ